MSQDRNESGKFELKGSEPRVLRSIRLTGRCWQVLGEVADDRGCSRSDVLEELAENNFEEVISDDDSIKQDIIAIIQEVLESLEPGNDPLIKVDHRAKAPGRRVLRELIDYLENSC